MKVYLAEPMPQVTTFDPESAAKKLEEYVAGAPVGAASNVLSDALEKIAALHGLAPNDVAARNQVLMAYAARQALAARSNEVKNAGSGLSAATAKAESANLRPEVSAKSEARRLERYATELRQLMRRAYFEGTTGPAELQSTAAYRLKDVSTDEFIALYPLYLAAFKPRPGKWLVRKEHWGVREPAEQLAVLKTLVEVAKTKELSPEARVSFQAAVMSAYDAKRYPERKALVDIVYNGFGPETAESLDAYRVARAKVMLDELRFSLESPKGRLVQAWLDASQPYDSLHGRGFRIECEGGADLVINRYGFDIDLGAGPFPGHLYDELRARKIIGVTPETLDAALDKVIDTISAKGLRDHLE